MDPLILNKIILALQRIEADNQVEILYACEAGSRAWGFESPDSDYDVRFIYKHKLDWYLRLDHGLNQNLRDVIELPFTDNLDINGWDLEKALRLMYKSNPPLLEWLGSPTVYKSSWNFEWVLDQLSKHYYSPGSCMWHYLNMAKSNFREYLKHDMVRTKKYFYVIRPVLACLWIEAVKNGKNLNPVVPVEFERLFEWFPKEASVRPDIENLLVRKRRGDELEIGPQIQNLNGWLDFEINRLQDVARTMPESKNDWEELNAIFKIILGFQ